MPDTGGIAIEALYAAAAEPAEWSKAITLLSEQFGAVGGMLVRNADYSELSSCITGGLESEIAERYVQDYTDNPWTRAARPVPVGEVAVMSQLYDLREGRHLAWYADVLRPTGTEDMAYLALPGFTSASSVGGFAFCFSASGAPATENAARRMRTLRPHLMRAVWLSQQVEKAQVLGQRLDEMLNSSSRPTLLLSPNHGVVSTNPAAEAFLQQADVLSIDLRGRLRAVAAADDKGLQAAIVRAVNLTNDEHPAPMAVTIDRSNTAPLRLLLTPLPRSGALPAAVPESEAVVLVTVIDPGHKHDDKFGALLTIYRLTPGEARVAVLLASGMGRESAADRLHVSVETIKKHAANCFRKIGVSSQAGLAQVISNLPIDSRSDPAVWNIDDSDVSSG